MADTKSIKTSWGELGGNNKMHSFTPTGTQTPDRSSQEPTGGSRRDIKAKGGGNNGFYSESPQNKFGAGPQKPGQSHQESSRQDGFARGGTTKMFGNRGSLRAQPGKSSPC